MALVLLLPTTLFSADAKVVKQLTEALLCKGNPAQAVFSLVSAKNNFEKGFAAYGFGEDMSYRAIAILDSPLLLGSASTTAVISETENSNFAFGAFTYAKFKGDFRKIVSLLKLQPEKAPVGHSIGKYVSRQAPVNACPLTIILTPVEDGKDEFLLGCGWCNGG